MAQNKQNEIKNKKRFEQMGRAFSSVLEAGYVDHHRVYLINFIRGIFFGLGAALGGSFVVACLIWILTLFSEVPLVGDLFDLVRDSID